MSDPPPTLLIPTPLQRFTALEYPGSISTLPASLAIALNNLGGLDAITQSLNGNKNPISLNLSKNNLFSHPIDGQTVQTGNILLKISKRTKTGTNGGVYIMEWIGVVDKTVRFRGLC